MKSVQVCSVWWIHLFLYGLPINGKWVPPMMNVFVHDLFSNPWSFRQRGIAESPKEVDGCGHAVPTLYVFDVGKLNHPRIAGLLP